MAGTYPVPFARDAYWSDLFNELHVAQRSAAALERDRTYLFEEKPVFTHADVVIMFDAAAALGVFADELAR